MHYVRGASRALALAAVLAISAFVGTARAGDESENGTSNGPSVTTNATLTSDYRFRGFTQTQERAALQGGFEVTFHQFYVGLWASNVDFGDVLHAGHWKKVASYEVDTYVGYKHKFWGFQTDVRAIFYSYPGSFGDPNNLNYFEGMFGISREILPQLTLDFQAYYSPDYHRRDGAQLGVRGGAGAQVQQARLRHPIAERQDRLERGRREGRRHRLRLLERRCLLPVCRLLRVRHPLLRHLRDAVVGRQLHRPLRWARRGPHHVRELSQNATAPGRASARFEFRRKRWRYVAIAGSARGWATGAATPMRRTEIGALSMGSEGIPAQRLSAGSVSPFISSENWPRLAPRLISVS